MFSTNFEINENKGKKYLLNVADNGIWENLRLIKAELGEEENYVDFELMQEDTGMFHTERFYAPDPEANPIRIKIMLEEIEDMCSAFHPNIINEAGVNEKWGTESLNTTSFKEFVEFYTSKMEFPSKNTADLKILYKENTAPKVDGKIKYPKKKRGGRPFITSEHLPNKLSIERDLNNKNPQYNLYTSFEVLDMENPVTEGKAVDPTTLPF